MQNVQQEFEIDGRSVPWGTSLADACRLLDAAPAGGTAVSVPCSQACGFATLCAELSAPALERPVVAVSYELAPCGDGIPDPRSWIEPLSAQLGAPAELSHADIPAEVANPWDRVRCYARWHCGIAGLGVSVYGALRRVPAGESAGMLWLNWSEELAARPFLREWLMRSEALWTAGERHSSLEIYTLDWPQHPLYGEGGTSVPEEAAARKRRQLRLSLNHPRILATPGGIAGRLDTRQFAVWSSLSDGIWCVSTPWDSVMTKIGEPAAVTWIDLLPAKGPGYAALELNGWTVQGASGSPEVRRAAEEISRIPGVTVKPQRGYDC